MPDLSAVEKRRIRRRLDFLRKLESDAKREGRIAHARDIAEKASRLRIALA